MKNSKRGEIATLLTIGTLLVIGISSLVGTLFLSKNRATTSSRAADIGTCRDNPDSGRTPAGYTWNKDCDRQCNTNADCPKNTADPSNVNPETSNWCYGFEGRAHSTQDWRCLMLSRVGGPRSSNAAANASGQAQQTQQSQSAQTQSQAQTQTQAQTAVQPTAASTVNSGTAAASGQSAQCSSPTKINKQNVCDPACCGNNSECPAGQACVIANGNCNSNISCGASAAGSAASGSKDDSSAGGAKPPAATPILGCGKQCIYTESGQNYSGNCKDRSQACSFNDNCGFVSGCSSGALVSSGDTGQKTPYQQCIEQDPIELCNRRFGQNSAPQNSVKLCEGYLKEGDIACSKSNTNQLILCNADGTTTVQEICANGCDANNRRCYSAPQNNTQGSGTTGTSCSFQGIQCTGDEKRYNYCENGKIFSQDCEGNKICRGNRCIEPSAAIINKPKDGQIGENCKHFADTGLEAFGKKIRTSGYCDNDQLRCNNQDKCEAITAVSVVPTSVPKTGDFNGACIQPNNSCYAGVCFKGTCVERYVTIPVKVIVNTHECENKRRINGIEVVNSVSGEQYAHVGQGALLSKYTLRTSPIYNDEEIFELSVDKTRPNFYIKANADLHAQRDLFNFYRISSGSSVEVDPVNPRSLQLQIDFTCN